MWRATQDIRSRAFPERAKSISLRPGLNGLDNLLESYLDTDRPGYFVEAGANDGIRQSNTYFLEHEYGWRGLLVEPSLNNYLQLLRNRHAENSFACAACVPFNYPDQFVRLTYANLMTVSRTLDTDLHDVDAHLRDGTRFLKAEAEVVDFGAVARTMDSLLIAARAPHRIDLLSLDVEGAEIPVLRGINHERFRFRYMIIESQSPRLLGEFLDPLGYEFEAMLSGHDYLYRDRSSC